MHQATTIFFGSLTVVQALLFLEAVLNRKPVDAGLVEADGILMRGGDFLTQGLFHG